MQKYLLTAEEILALWESRYHELSPEWRKVFLNSKEIEILTTYKADLVVRAIGRVRKLSLILLEVLEPEKYQQVTSKGPDAPYLAENLHETKKPHDIDCNYYGTLRGAGVCQCWGR